MELIIIHSLICSTSYHKPPQETGFRGILFGNELKLKYKLQSGLTGSTLNPLHHHLKVCVQSQVACIMNQKSRWLSRGTSYRFFLFLSLLLLIRLCVLMISHDCIATEEGGEPESKWPSSVMSVVIYSARNLKRD